MELKGEGAIMSKIIKAVANDDYSVTIDFEYGNKLTFNMQKQIKTLPFFKLNEKDFFKTVKFDDKSIYWDDESGSKNIIPLRLSIDNILFSLRD